MTDLYLSSKLSHRGTPAQIKKTINRIKENKSADAYMTNHPPLNGTLINPHSIKEIVEDYYKKNNPIVPIETISSESLIVPSAPENDYEFIKAERDDTGRYCPYHGANKMETWYYYKDKKTGVIRRSRTKHHGGKRKSRRNQKSKKSSKKSSKKLRKSNRRR